MEDGEEDDLEFPDESASLGEEGIEVEIEDLVNQELDSEEGDVGDEDEFDGFEIVNKDGEADDDWSTDDSGDDDYE